MLTLLRNKLALAGLVIILVFLALALLAPILVGPYPNQSQRGTPLRAPSSAHPLGTDW
ncbi:MAG: hypothetical protein WC985_09630 [Thermoplasmata archaeon]